MFGFDWLNVLVQPKLSKPEAHRSLASQAPTRSSLGALGAASSIAKRAAAIIVLPYIRQPIEPNDHRRL